MTDKDQEQRIAMGKLGIAIRRLAGNYPFHAAILEQFEPVHRADVATMGVTICQGKLALVFQAAFVLALPIDQLEGVLLHEVHHVLFGHVLADPEEYPDEWARTVAEEVTVNEFITEPLPDGVIELEQFPALKPLQSTDDRYTQLKRRVRRPPIAEPVAANSPEPTGPPNSGNTQLQAGAGGLRTVDDHSLWQEARQDPDLAKSVIEQVIQTALLEVGRENVPDYLSKAVGIQKSARGDCPGDNEIELKGGRQGRLDWRKLLRHYVGQLRELRPVFNRPPRRFPEMVGIIPGRRRQAARSRIMAVIDTSGSVTPELLEMFSAELQRLARDFVVTVVECDAAIQRVYLYRRLENVVGGCGTDFRPPFERDFLKKHKPDMVIYFTDGAGPVPDKEPPVKVVWCLTPGGEIPAKWGKVIQMAEER